MPKPSNRDRYYWRDAKILLTAATLAGSAITYAATQETKSENSNIRNALATYKTLGHQARIADAERNVLRYETKAGTLQLVVDAYEQGKLPPVMKNGKVIGYKTVNHFEIPNGVSDEQRAKIQSFGVPLTADEVAGWKKEYAQQGRPEFDPNSIVKVDADAFTNKQGDVTRYVPLDKWGKFMGLCEALDGAYSTALPGYEQTAAQADAAAGAAEARVEQLAYNTGGVFDGNRIVH